MTKYKEEFLEKISNFISENGNPICPGRNCDEEITPNQPGVLVDDCGDIEFWHINCAAEDEDEALFDMGFGG